MPTPSLRVASLPLPPSHPYSALINYYYLYSLHAVVNTPMTINWYEVGTHVEIRIKQRKRLKHETWKCNENTHFTGHFLIIMGTAVLIYSLHAIFKIIFNFPKFFWVPIPLMWYTSNHPEIYQTYTILILNFLLKDQ